jgi:hypothetical protein
VKEAYILFLLALMTYKNRRRVVNQDHGGSFILFLGGGKRGRMGQCVFGGW